MADFVNGIQYDACEIVAVAMVIDDKTMLYNCDKRYRITFLKRIKLYYKQWRK